MRELDGASWRARTAVLFQDFTRFELAAQESIGVGELGEIDSRAAVTEAIGRASAGSLLTRLDGDLERLLGRGYGDGTDLSGGQWQSVAFSRTLMRRTPLLVCLDEPGHSLDPFTEQRVVEAYERNARQLADENGGVSVFVTHRLSTVRFADIIVVLERGRVAEVGSHAELLRANARYAELYRLQARAYT